MADKPTPSDRLDSWKEIAAYLDRDVRTVARWEKSEGLPVHRHLHLKKPTVYAFEHEIDAWWTNRRQKLGHAVQSSSSGVARRWALLGSIIGAAVLASFYLLPARTGERERTLEEASPEFVVKRVSFEGVDLEACRPRAVARHGQWIACFADTGIGVIDVRAGSLRMLTNAWGEDEGPTAGPVFSPDGEQVAYTWTRRGSDVFELAVSEVFGTTRTLYRGDGIEPLPLAWSPDGQWLATTLLEGDERWKLVLLSTIDGSERFLQEGAPPRRRRASFSPDGRFLAYETAPMDGGAADIDMVDVDTGEVTRLTEHPRDDGHPYWLRDGRGIFFLSDRTGSVDAWLLPMDGSNPSGRPLLLQRSVGSVIPIGLTDNGNLYYFGPGLLSDMYSADVDFHSGRVTRNPEPISAAVTGVSAHPAWSPDGERLAYVSGRGWREGSRVWVRDLDTGAERALDSMVFARRPYWSPDGSLLLVRGTDTESRRGTFALDPQTGSVVSQHVQGLHETAHWLADGRLLVADLDLRMGGGRIYIRGIDGAEETPLFVAPPTTWISRTVAVSSDGQNVAFTIHERPTNTTRLFLADTNTGRVQELMRADDGTTIAPQDFTPDGRFILFVEASPEKGRQLARISTDTGEVVPIELDIDDAQLFTIHPNGRTIGFTVVAHDEPGLYVMERAIPEK